MFLPPPEPSSLPFSQKIPLRHRGSGGPRLAGTKNRKGTKEGNGVHKGRMWYTEKEAVISLLIRYNFFA